MEYQYSGTVNGLKVYTGMYSNKNEPYYNDEVDALWEKANYDLEAKWIRHTSGTDEGNRKIVLDEVAAARYTRHRATI